MAAIIAAVRRYQAAPRPSSPPPPPIAASAGSAKLLHYGGGGVPLVLVPSLLNPPYILDLSLDRSFARWLAARGFDVHLVDWEAPAEAERLFDLSGYVTERLEPLLACLERPILAGYCLGGTLAIAAAARGSLRALVTIAAPWDFRGYAEERRKDLAGYWHRVRPLAASIGQVPMDLIQPAFWALDPALPPRKFERYAAMEEGSSAARSFERLEDWANGGPALALPAATEALKDLFGDNLTGEGRWCVGGSSIRLQDVRIPWLDIRSATDCIVPAAAAPAAPAKLQVAAGHVGMMAGSGAHTGMWQPLGEWLQTV